MTRNVSAGYSGPRCCGHAEEIAELRGELADLRARVDELARATAGAGQVTPAAIRAPGATLTVESRHEEQPAAPARAARYGGGLPHADRGSPEAVKIALYRALFAGREDPAGADRARPLRVAGACSGWACSRHPGDHPPDDELAVTTLRPGAGPAISE